MTSNRDWLMRLAHEAPDELSAWMDAEHAEPTNVIADETNGIRADAPLVARDPVEIMRKCSGMKHGIGSLRKVLGIECVSGWQMRCLHALADMVERDYVSREAYEDLRDEFTWTNSFLHRVGRQCGTKDVPSLKAYVEKLEAEAIEYDKALDAVKNERDELKAKLEEYENIEFVVPLEDAQKYAMEPVGYIKARILELQRERDEWKAKAESALHENPYVGLVRGEQWERTEVSDYYCGGCGWKVTDHDSYCPECGGALHGGSSKVRAGLGNSAKRAAAAERLKDARYHTLADYVRAMLGWGHEPHFEDCRDALIDLLSDDNGEGRSSDGVAADATLSGRTNLEWHYIHDEGFCIAVGEQALARLDDAPSHPHEVFGWLMAPHGDGKPPERVTKLEWHYKRRDDAEPVPTLRDLYGVLGEENDPETPISAEIPQKTGEQGADSPANADRAESIADLLGQTNSVTDEGLAYLAEWHLPSVISMLRDYEDEKLMRDCDLEMNVLLSTECLQAKVDELQAEIAKRDKGIERLKRQRDEARAQLDRKPTDAVREFAARYEQRIAELEDELHRSYDAQTAKAEELTLRGVRIAELQEQVDMLTERKCPGYEPENHYCRYHAQDFELNDSTVSRLKRENARLTKERDGWRMRCGELLDAAHAMQGVADAWDEEV